MPGSAGESVDVPRPAAWAEYHLAHADLRPVTDWCIQTRSLVAAPEPVRHGGITIWLSVASILLLAILLAVLQHIMLVVLAAVILLPAYLVLRVGMNYPAQRQRSVVTAALENAVEFGVNRVELHPGHVLQRSPSGSAHIPWCDVDGLTAEDGFLCLWQVGGEAILIPRHAFVSRGEMRTFELAARRLLEESGCSPIQRMANLLARVDYPCPKCRYNLRGVATGMCPECGSALELERIVDEYVRIGIAAPARPGRPSTVQSKLSKLVSSREQRGGPVAILYESPNAQEAPADLSHNVVLDRGPASAAPCRIEAETNDETSK